MNQVLTRITPELTERQREVVELIAAGSRTKELASVWASHRGRPRRTVTSCARSSVSHAPADPNRLPLAHGRRPALEKPRIPARIRGLRPVPAARAAGRADPRISVGSELPCEREGLRYKRRRLLSVQPPTHHRAATTHPHARRKRGSDHPARRAGCLREDNAG